MFNHLWFAAHFQLVRRHLGKFALALLLSIVVISAIPRIIFGPTVAAEKVIQRDFVQSVVASGRVETPHRIDIGVQITGTVAKIPVTEGQVVNLGQSLIELEDAELQASLSQAELAVQQARAKLRQLQEVQAPVAEQALHQAEINYTTAKQTLLRNQTLFTKGFIGQAALDEATRSEQIAASQVRSAQQTLNAMRPNGSDTAVAQAALTQAIAGADAARARLAYAAVKAPVAGTLISRNVERGDIVQPGKVLMTLSPTGDTQLVVQIDEKNLKLLKLDQPALASADAYAEQRFNAVLAYINPGVDAQRGSVEIKLRVPNPPSYLKQDMTVSVDIEVARRNNAVLIPSDAVHDASSQSPWVLLYDNGRAKKTPLKLGLRANGYSEVLEGFGKDQLLIASSNTTIANGDRVRIQAKNATQSTLP
jgi:HlyD family secretion protein